MRFTRITLSSGHVAFILRARMVRLEPGLRRLPLLRLLGSASPRAPGDCLFNGLCRGLFALRFNLAGGIIDVGDVYIDQLKPNFFCAVPSVTNEAE